MPYTIGTSYSFISNNLRCGTVDSVLIPIHNKDQLPSVNVTIPFRSINTIPKTRANVTDSPPNEWDGKCSPHGPAERRLRAVTTIHRMRNSLSSDAVKLDILSSSVPNGQPTDPFSSRDSSPSSSSSVPLSPASSANAPLLQKSRSKSAQRLATSRLILKVDQKTGKKKRKYIKVAKFGSNSESVNSRATAKPVLSPASSIGHTARRVWNALERRFLQTCNQNTRISQSQSISGLDREQQLDAFELCTKKLDGRSTRLAEMLTKECLSRTEIDNRDQGRNIGCLNSVSMCTFQVARYTYTSSRYQFDTYYSCFH